jgi:hypothetical protein
MLGSLVKAALIAAAAALLAAMPAFAQFGTIFGNEPPRPPAQVLRPPPQSPPPQQQPGAPQGSIQSQPLPPPPGSGAPDRGAPTDIVPQQSSLPRPPAGQQPGQAPLSGLPPGQRQPRGTPGAPGTPMEETVTEAPSQKIVNPTAVFSGLDKITGRIITFDVAIGETVQFGALQVTPRVCYTRPPTETSNTDAFIEVDEVTLQGEVKRVFTGWMFASSPGLHAVEHPIYDVWLTDCKGGATVAEAPAAPEPAPAAQRPAQRQPAPQQRRAPPPQPLPPPPGRF